MSVRSANTAVTCEKPLRDSERVLSRPGAPASAVSIGKVICFSISTGESAGAMVLIWTCLLVMSGTASIGSFVSAYTPSTAAMAPRITTTQRRRIAKSMICPIMSVFVLGFALFQLRLQRERVGKRVDLAGRKPAQDLDVIIILMAGPHLPGFEAVGLAHEQRRRALDCLQRLARDNDLRGLMPQRDLRSDEGAGPPAVVGIRQRGDDARITCLAVEQRADEDDLSAGLLLDADGMNADILALVHGGNVFRRNREIDPDIVEIDDHEQFALLSLPADQPAEVDAPLR